MKTFSITDVGMVRQVNQDYVYTTDKPLGPLPNLYVVADGMGGHQAGDFASKYTVEVLKRELAASQEEDIEKALVSAIKTAKSRDHQKGVGRPAFKGDGNDDRSGDDRTPYDVFCECGRQPSLPDQSGDHTADERPLSCRRDGPAWRHQTGRGKASSG